MWRVNLAELSKGVPHISQINTNGSSSLNVEQRFCLNVMGTGGRTSDLGPSRRLLLLRAGGLESVVSMSKRSLGTSTLMCGLSVGIELKYLSSRRVESSLDIGFGDSFLASSLV